MPQRSKTSPRSPNGVYLFTGEDEFRKELSLDRLKARLFGGKIDPFNYELYYGQESRAEEIIRSLETVPLGNGKKLVVLKEPELLPEEERDRLASYLKRFEKNRTIFVLLSETLPVPDDEFSSALSKYAELVDFKKFKPDEISSWIIKEFKARNKIANRQTAELIREVTQADLRGASSLVEQISIFTDKREKITAEDILPFSEASPPEQSAFELLDYINEKDTGRSLKTLKNLLGWDNNPSQIIGLLGWHLARLITIKRMLSSRISRSNMASYFNIGTYILNKLISQTENFTLGQLKDHLNTLAETDLMLKNSGIKGELLLEMLVVKLGAVCGR